ncbi:MAG: CstA-like transporter-associated (seleno)protein [Steroidobacteraceae bacterium]
MTAIARICRLAWSRLRSMLGDDAYERYLDHFRRRHPGIAPLEPAAFHRAELDRRWSQVNRCC